MKSTKWPLQDAKNRFSEVVRLATEEGPQTVTKHGRPSVVVMSIEHYRQLEKPKSSLVDFFRNSPLAGVDLDIERTSSNSRDVDL